MDKQELLDCMRHAADALAEFRHHLPKHSPEAHHQVEQARQHFEYAIVLLNRATRQTGPDDGDPPRLRAAE